MKRNIWLVRPLPHGTNHMKDFLEDEFVAVGYPLGENLAQYDKAQIRFMLKKHNWERGLGNVNILVHIMNEGDLVVVPDDNKKDVYFGKITSDYVYVKELDKDIQGSGYPHQRKVEWYFDKKPLLRDELSEELKDSMRFPGTISDITKHYEIINNLLSGSDVAKVNSSLEEKALKVIEKLLESNDPVVRLEAAKIILNK